MSAEVIEMTPHMLQHAGVLPEGNQYNDSTAFELGVEDVIVADRYRKELGDVSDLKKSIVEIGLLNPITVREWHGGYRLVAGERRLTAFKELGLAEIPVRVARDIADARDALVAERDENTARKEMLPSEKVALGMAIEEMEKPAAMERMYEGRNQHSEPCVPGNTGHRSRDTAAEAVDLSPATYTRLKTLVNLSDDEAQPVEVQDAAREALSDIDQGAPIRRGYDKVKEVRRKSESVTTEKPALEVDGRTKRSEEIATWHAGLALKYPTPKHAYEAEGHQRHSNLDAFKGAIHGYGVKYRFNETTYGKHARTSQDRLYRASLSLEVAIGVFEHIDLETITKEQAEDALQRIDTRAFNLIIRSLKEITNG